MRLIPIFDTSVLSDLSDTETLAHLHARIPKHGCPISAVTLLELVYGLCRGDPAQVEQTLKPITLAYTLSRRGHVLPFPPNFLKKQIFQINNWERDRVSTNLSNQLEAMLRPNFCARFLAGDVSEINCAFIEQMFEMTHRDFHENIRRLLDELNPEWRKGGERLTERRRQEIRNAIFVENAPRIYKQLLEGWDIPVSARNEEKVKHACDAHIEYQKNLTWLILSTAYNFDENARNDFHDWMQLLYLGHPPYCLVTADGKMKRRVEKSEQAARILTVGEFIETAAEL